MCGRINPGVRYQADLKTNLKTQRPSYSVAFTLNLKCFIVTLLWVFSLSYQKYKVSIGNSSKAISLSKICILLEYFLGMGNLEKNIFSLLYLTSCLCIFVVCFYNTILHLIDLNI